MKLKRSKLSHFQTNKLIELFVAGVTARTAADLVGVNRNTAINFFRKIREKICKHQEKTSPFFGKVEADESFFGGRRKGKRGRGAGGKIPVFGLLKRNGKVYAEIIPNCKSETLIPIIREKVMPDSIVYTDNFRSYNTLDISGYHHFRINHSKKFVDKEKHINGIENFWNQAKRHMRKFNGLSPKTFNLYLKECEWRFNNGSPRQLLHQIRKILKSA